MSYADLILTLLEKQQVEFETVQAPNSVSLKEDWLERTVPLASIARMMALQDKQGIVLAFYPATQKINLQYLQQITHRNLAPVSTNWAELKLLNDMHVVNFDVCSDSGWQIIIDENLSQQDFIFFEAPGSCKLIRIASENFGAITHDVLLGCCFTDEENNTRHHDKTDPANNISDRIAKIEHVPAIPDMTARILVLRNNHNSTVSDLVELIEADLSLSQQILRYANSTLFSSPQPVHNLKDAIFKVLGYETVLHIALAYSICRIFRLPPNGPLGQIKFWQHAIYSATIMHRLVFAMPTYARPKPGLAYLSGLLHDIGLLALNLLFKNEYEWFNKLLSVNTGKSVVALEKRTLGISHNELGAWLAKAWELPEELIACVEHHHNLGYIGPYSNYAHLSNLTERLLKTHGMSDSDTDEIPEELLEKLGLNEEEVYLIMDEVLQGEHMLKTMVSEIA